MKTLLLVALASTPLLAQTSDPTLPPSDAKVVATAIGHGVQIYRCEPQPAGTTPAFKWVLQGPEAELFDAATRQQVGTHGAGPVWHWVDGSEVQGKVLQTQPSADPKNIPWLLLEAHSTGGEGVLAKVTLIRRSDTHAGAPPVGACNATNDSNTVTTLRMPYLATYTFYTTAK